MRTFVEGVQDIVNVSQSLKLSEHSLIGKFLSCLIFRINKITEVIYSVSDQAVDWWHGSFSGLHIVFRCELGTGSLPIGCTHVRAHIHTQIHYGFIVVILFISLFTSSTKFVAH
jgi:hypothetical protein